MRHASVRRLGFILGIAAGLMCVEEVSANAAVLAYTFDLGTSFTFKDGGDGRLTGTFAINPSSNGFLGDDVGVTAGKEAGIYAPDSIPPQPARFGPSE